MAAAVLAQEASAAPGDVKEPLKTSLQENARDWKYFSELALTCRSQVALGPAEVERAHAESVVSILFLSEGRFPQVEKLVPRMRDAGFVCHIVGSGHAFSSDVDKHGLAAILHKPVSSPLVTNASARDQPGNGVAAVEKTDHVVLPVASSQSLEPAPSSTTPSAEAILTLKTDSIDVSSAVRQPPPPPPPPPPPVRPITGNDLVMGLSASMSLTPQEVPLPARKRSRSPRPRIVPPPNVVFAPMEIPEPVPPPPPSVVLAPVEIPEPAQPVIPPADTSFAVKPTPAAIAAAPWRRAPATEQPKQADFSVPLSAKPPPAPPPPPRQFTHDPMDLGAQAVFPKKAPGVIAKDTALNAAVGKAKASSWDSSWDAPQEAHTSTSLNQASVIGSTESPWEATTSNSSSSWGAASSGDSHDSNWASQGSWQGSAQGTSWSASSSQTSTANWGDNGEPQNRVQSHSQNWENGVAKDGAWPAKPSLDHWQNDMAQDNSWAQSSEQWETQSTAKASSVPLQPSPKQPPPTNWEIVPAPQTESWGQQDWESNNASNESSWSAPPQHSSQQWDEGAAQATAWSTESSQSSPQHWEGATAPTSNSWSSHVQKPQLATAPWNAAQSSGNQGWRNQQEW